MHKIEKIHQSVQDKIKPKKITSKKGYVIKSDKSPISFSTLKTNEKGMDGIDWVRGLPTNLDKNAKYEPVSARGIGGDLGAYQQYAKTDPDFQDSYNTLVQNLQRGHWEIQKNEWISEEQLELHEEIIEWLYKSFFLSGKVWKQFINEWATSLVCGFAIWEPVYTKDACLKKLAQRKAFIVEEWMFDKDERELLYVKFKDANGQEVIIPADELLIYSHRKEGTNYEGESVIRSIAFYIELKQYLLKIFAASSEVNGMGMKVIETNTESDASEDNAIVGSIANARAEQNPIISLPNGKTFKWLSPNGNILDIKSMLDYCDQKIKAILSAEGSLLGFQNVGSFALASEQAKGEIASAQYYGELICDMFNADGSPLRAIVDAKFGPQEFYPLLSFQAQKEAEMPEHKIQMLMTLKQHGMPITTDDWNMIRKAMGLDAIVEEDSPVVEEVDEMTASFSCCDHHKSKKKDNVRLMFNVDADQYRQYFINIEKNISKELQAEAKSFRTEWVERAGSATSPTELVRVIQDMEPRKTRFIERIQPQLRDGLLRGAATTMKELGLIKSLRSFNPNQGLSSNEIEAWVSLESYRIATHFYNVLVSYLEEQSVQELYQPTAVRKRPEIPTYSATQKIVATYSGNIINKGREATILAIEGMTTESKPIIAYRTSVLEKTTCDPCRELDGTRAFVGSKEYMRLSPPNKCQGGGRCRCIWSYEMPGTQAYEDALNEFKNESGFQFSQSVNEEDGFHHLVKDVFALMEKEDTI